MVNRLMLDVGAGHRACGDVNVDLHPEGTFHRLREDQSHAQCRTRCIPNFVKADGQHLPFRDGCFDGVTCSHMLEHVENPVQAMREMLRVTRDCVSITVPHRFGRYAKQPCHRHYFNSKWFARVLDTFPEVYSWTTKQETRGVPLEVFSLFRVPSQITVSFRKTQKQVGFKGNKTCSHRKTRRT